MSISLLVGEVDLSSIWLLDGYGLPHLCIVCLKFLLIPQLVVFFLVVSSMPLHSHYKYWWQNNSKQQVSASNSTLSYRVEARWYFSHLVQKSKKWGLFFFLSLMHHLVLFPNKKHFPSSFRMQIFVRTKLLAFTDHYHVTDTIWSHF